MTTMATAWMVTRLGAPTDALEIRTVDVDEPGANQVRIAVEVFLFSTSTTSTPSAVDTDC